MNKQYEVVKFIDKDLELEVSIDPQIETVWLTQNEIAYLFDKDRKTITRHIQNIINELELDEKEVCSKKEHTASDGKVYIVNIYNLDMVIAIGYRVKSHRAIIFRKWATKVLKEYLLKGYVINDNRTLVTNENYIRLINKVESLDSRVSNIEHEHKLLEYKNKQLFFDGDFYDAYSFIQQLFEKAETEITIFDNYIDRSILDRLIVKKDNVKVVIYTSAKAKLLESDIISFNNQYGDLQIEYVNNVHDRFIIIDRKKLYHLGHSIKDLGKKIFSINELDKSLIEDLLNKMKLM